MVPNKKYVRIGLILIAVGVIGIISPLVWSGFFTDYFFLRSLASSHANEPAVNATPAPASPKTPDYNLSSVKDRLIISKAKIDMPLFEGSNPSILAKGGWIFPGTSTPDKGGNTAIFGHRFKYLPPISNTFYNLDKVLVGDKFQIIWQGKTYDYKVIETKVIEPTEVDVLNPSKSPIVTLVTCWPLFSSKQRFIVIGQLSP